MSSSLTVGERRTLLEAATSWIVRRAGLARVGTGLFAAGLSANALVSVDVTIALLAAASVVVSGVGVLARQQGRYAPLLLVPLALVTGLALGSLRMEQLFGGSRSDWAGREVSLRVAVTGPSSRLGERLRAPVQVLASEGWCAPGLPDSRLFLEVRERDGSGGAGGADGPRDGFDAEEGILLQVRGRLLEPRPTAPGGFDEAAYLRARGIGLRLEADAGAVRVLGRRGGVRGALDSLRRRADAHLAIALGPPWPAVLRGVVLGEQQHIPGEMLAAFRGSGTSHILSVSGLHVAALAAIVCAVVGFLPVGRLPRLATAVVVVVAFAALTGAGPPVTRATVMLVMWLLARELGRGRDGVQFLLLAAVFVLGRNPASLADPGAQLSFAAVAGLLILSRPMEHALRRLLPGALAAGAAVSLSATVATAPLSLVHFDQVSISGVAANLLVVPVVAPVMGLGLASIVLGFAVPAAAGVLNVLAAALMGWIVSVSEVCAQAPVLQRRHVAWVVAASMGAVLALPICLAVRGRRPGDHGFDRLAHRFASPVATGLRRWFVGSHTRGGRPPVPGGIATRRVTALMVGLLVAGACGGAGIYLLGGRAAGALVLARAARGWPVAVEVRVLDVGEGSAALIRTPGRHAVLVDGGPARTDLYGQLRALGVERLDLVIVSHPHADHTGGLADVIDRLPIGALLDATDDDWVAHHAESTSEAAAYVRLLVELQKDGCRVGDITPGTELTVDGVTIHAFGPPGSSAGPWDAEKLNAGSLVLMMRAAAFTALLPGDAEASALARYQLPPVDMLVVPHHGSRDAVNTDLLGRLRPDVAVISVGGENSFGHPAPETLDSLREAGVPTWRTDRVGWVAVGAADVPSIGLQVRVERPAAGGSG